LGYDTLVTRKRTLVVALGAAIALIVFGLVVIGLFATSKRSSREDASVRPSASASSPSKELRRARRRPAQPLVAPRAEAESATGASIAGRVVDDVTGRGVAAILQNTQPWVRFCSILGFVSAMREARAS